MLRIGGAAVLVFLGARSLLARHRAAGDAQDNEQQEQEGRLRRAGWRAGLVTSVSNPKLAVFFVALFPQFLMRGSPVLPYALAMAAAVVALDII